MVGKAEELFKKAVDISGSNGTAELELADLYVHVKNYDKAEKIYRRVIDAQSKNLHTEYEAHQGLGEVAYLTGRMELAEKENMTA